MLTALLEPGHITQRGQQYTLTCKELGIAVRGTSPSHELCREILRARPDLSGESLGITRDGAEVDFRIPKIGTWAKLSTQESDKGGLSTVPYKEFRGIPS